MHAISLTVLLDLFGPFREFLHQKPPFQHLQGSLLLDKLCTYLLSTGSDVAFSTVWSQALVTINRWVRDLSYSFVLCLPVSEGFAARNA